MGGFLAMFKEGGKKHMQLAPGGRGRRPRAEDAVVPSIGSLLVPYWFPLGPFLLRSLNLREHGSILSKFDESTVFEKLSSSSCSW